MSVRTRIAAVAVAVGALGLVGPIAAAGAQTTQPDSATPVLATTNVVPAIPPAFQAGLQAAESGWEQGLQAAEEGWAAGAQAAQAGFAAGAAALGLPAPVVSGVL